MAPAGMSNHCTLANARTCSASGPCSSLLLSCLHLTIVTATSRLLSQVALASRRPGLGIVSRHNAHSAWRKRGEHLPDVRQRIPDPGIGIMLIAVQLGDKGGNVGLQLIACQLGDGGQPAAASMILLEHGGYTIIGNSP